MARREDSKGMIRAAVVFTHYGSHHFARADGLSKAEGIDAHFVELANVQQLYPWKTARNDLGFPFTTLVNTPYERTPFIKLYKELTEFLGELNPEAVVVHGYSPPIVLACARWAKVRGAASIMMYESTALDRPRVWWKEQIKRQLVKRYYDAGFVGGKASRHYLSRLGMPHDRIWERYDVVDNDHFARRSRDILERATEHRERAALPERYFLYVGRFSPEKNLVRLLQAYGRYRDVEPDGWKLVMVGDGPQRKELLETAESLNLDGVIWPGFVQVDEELPAYYALSSGFILPSISEPWGLVVNEAMACGLPVLASNRCGSALDLVAEGENGYTFDPYSIDEISDRMVRLAGLDEPERIELGKASSDIIAGFTPEVWGQNLADCIRQTVARKARKARKPLEL